MIRAPLPAAAVAARRAVAEHPNTPILLFDGRTGAVVDLDLRGDEADIIARYTPSPAPRGRPKLGVVAREVTLLPRHWDWLARQSASASVTLRRLIDAAERADGGKSQETARREAAYRFMAAIAGDFPGFEEASRALFHGDFSGLSERMARWPGDIRDQVLAYLGPRAD